MMLKIKGGTTDPFLFVLQRMQFPAPDGGEGKHEVTAKFLRAHFQFGNQKELLSIN